MSTEPKQVCYLRHECTTLPVSNCGTHFTRDLTEEEFVQGRLYNRDSNNVILGCCAVGVATLLNSMSHVSTTEKIRSALGIKERLWEWNDTTPANIRVPALNKALRELGLIKDTTN